MREDGRLVRLEHERGRSIDLVWDDEHVTAARASDGRRVTYSYDDTGRLVGVTGPLGTRHLPLERRRPGRRGHRRRRRGRGREHLRRPATRAAPALAARPHHALRLPAGRVTVVSDTDGTRLEHLDPRRARAAGRRRGRRRAPPVDELRRPRQRRAGHRARRRHHRPRVRRPRPPYPHRHAVRRRPAPTATTSTTGSTTVVAEAGADHRVRLPEDDAASRHPAAHRRPRGRSHAAHLARRAADQVVDPVGSRSPSPTTSTATWSPRPTPPATPRASSATTPVASSPPPPRRAPARPTPTTRPGLLASRRDPDGAMWHYEHTAAGRLTAIIDPTGARTEVEHGEHGEETRTIDPLGRAVTRTSTTSATSPPSSCPTAHVALHPRRALAPHRHDDPDGHTWTQDTTPPAGHRDHRPDRGAHAPSPPTGSSAPAPRRDAGVEHRHPLRPRSAGRWPTEQADGADRWSRTTAAGVRSSRSTRGRPDHGCGATPPGGSSRSSGPRVPSPATSTTRAAASPRSSTPPAARTTNTYDADWPARLADPADRRGRLDRVRRLRPGHRAPAARVGHARYAYDAAGRLK